MTVTTNEILAALKKGPKTRSELAEEFGISRERLSAPLLRLRAKSKMCPRRIHIKDYVFEGLDGERQYPRARFALGDKPDAEKPAPKPMAQVKREYRLRQKQA